jgi:hypothetical protein
VRSSQMMESNIRLLLECGVDCQYIKKMVVPIVAPTMAVLNSVDSTLRAKV